MSRKTKKELVKLLASVVEYEAENAYCKDTEKRYQTIEQLVKEERKRRKEA